MTRRFLETGLLGLGALLATATAGATTPYPSQHYRTSSGAYRVELRPRFSEPLALYGRGGKLLRAYDRRALGLKSLYRFSTAGYWWYENAITFLGFKTNRREIVPGRREDLTALHISLGQAF